MFLQVRQIQVRSIHLLEQTGKIAQVIFVRLNFVLQFERPSSLNILVPKMPVIGIQLFRPLTL